jgi:ferrous iron transport protein B
MIVRDSQVRDGAPAAGRRHCSLTIALAGNPNIGKSTLFNELTGLRQYVGNWPGKTVARAEGYRRHRNECVRLVDLPGTYSLLSTSPDEVIARECLLSGEADAVIAVVDATNLERTLYFVLQCLEIHDRVLVAVNMIDAAEQGGLKIDTAGLSRLLGVPVVAIAAARRRGLDELLLRVVDLARGDHLPPKRDFYGPAVEEAFQRMERALAACGLPDEAGDGPPRRWLAGQLLKGNTDALDRLDPVRREELRRETDLIRAAYQGDLSTDLARERYEFVHRAAREVIRRDGRERPDLTQRVDEIVTHRWFSFPVMLAALGVILSITMFGAEPMGAVLEAFFVWLAGAAAAFMITVNAPYWIAGPLVDGVIVGVGAVVSVMLPTMAIFFVLFALLEDSGFIPRIAFNMDRPMQAVGSQGKHCLTCMMGYGCNIPGVMSTRILEGNHRLIAVITNSLIPCNGRIGVMLPLALLFFGAPGILVVGALFVISMGTVMASTFLLSRTVLKGPSPTFAMELPPYRKPQFGRVIMRTVRERVLHVLVRAASIAAPVTVLIWFVGNYPAGAGFEHTLAGRLGAVLEPAGRFLGLDGGILTAILFAVPAKEIVIGTLAIMNGLAANLSGSALLEGVLAANWTTLTAFNFLLFYMLCIPCVYTGVTIYRETKSVRWTAWAMLLPLSWGILLTFTAHRVGIFLGLG